MLSLLQYTTVFKLNGDVLDLLTENQIGHALWNFRGDFGILNSGRKDIEYEDWYAHKLDRKMLELLKKH